MNLGELQAEIGRLLSDPNNDQWIQAVLLARINQAQIEIQGFTDAVKTPESLTPVSGTATITLDSDTMDIIRAIKTDAQGNIKPFQGINREELDFLYPDWQNWQDGEPLFWFYDATNQKMNLIPAPDSLWAVTNGITVWESLKPAALVNSTDIPFDSNNQMVPYHMTIVFRVVAQCWLDNGSPESLAKSKYFMSGDMTKPGLYEKQLGRITAEFDVPMAIPSRILFRPQGGRIGGTWAPSKSNPLPW